MSFRPAICGAFGPTTLACLRAWGRRGWEPGILAVEKPGDVPPASRYMRFSGQLPAGAVGMEHGLRIVEDFLSRNRVASLLCVEETAAMWLDSHRERLEKLAKLWVPPASVLARSLSKGAQVELASEAGFDLLPTYALRLGEDLPGIPEDEYPLCLRPQEAGKVRPAFKVDLARSRDGLVDFMKRLTSTEAPVLAQPYLDAPNLVVHGARTPDGRELGLAAFLVERKFEGVTLCIRPHPMPEGLADKCRAFTAGLKLVGNYHFEFLLDPASGRAYFLELNPRFGGTTAKVLALGYDEPGLAVEAFGGPKAPAWAPGSGVAGNRLAVVKCLAAALRGRVTPLDYPSASKMRRAMDLSWFFCALRDEVLSLDDLRGAAGLYEAVVKGALKTRSKPHAAAEPHPSPGPSGDDA